MGVALKRAVGVVSRLLDGNLLGAGVLGHSLGALRHGVLGQLSGEEQTDGGLDFPGSDGGPPVVVSQTAGLGGNALEDVVDEGVHDGHGLAGDASVGVHLLQHFVDVDGVRFSPPPPLLLIPSTLGLSLGGCLLGSLACCLGRHFDAFNTIANNQLMVAQGILDLYTRERAVFAAKLAAYVNSYLQKQPAHAPHTSGPDSAARRQLLAAKTARSRVYKSKSAEMPHCSFGYQTQHI